MADRRDKLNKTLIMIGIVSAVVVIIIAKIFQMKPQSLISVIAVIWAALVVARMFIVNSKNKEYSKMLEHLNRILGEENDPERYIEMCNNYINRVDDESFKAMLMTNLAAGYATMCRYDEASEALKKVDVSKLAESHKAILYNNLAQYAFLTGKIDEARKYVADNKPLLFKYFRTKNMSTPFIVTFAFEYYYQGNKESSMACANKILNYIKKAQTLSANDKCIVEKLEELKKKIADLPDEEYDEDVEEVTSGSDVVDGIIPDEDVDNIDEIDDIDDMDDNIDDDY